MVLTPGVRPNIQLIANGSDITSMVAARLSSLRITDGTGWESDELEIVLADTDPASPVRRPPPGAQLRPFIGYDGSFIDMGLFIADEVEMAGWPGMMTIRARSAIFAVTEDGKNGLQEQRSQVWAEGTTIGDLVATVAARHGMTALVSPVLKGIQLPHTTQQAESDLSLLTRLAQQYDAVFKPANGQILFYPKGSGQTVAGVAIPPIMLKPGDISSFSMTQRIRSAPGTVVAVYHEPRAAAHYWVAVGSGQPVKRLRLNWANQSEALWAAKSALAQAIRRQVTMSIKLQGAPSIIAEQPVVLSGFHPDIPPSWVASKVTHAVDKQGAYTCSIDAELPNNAALIANQQVDTGSFTNPKWRTYSEQSILSSLQDD